MTYLEYLKQYTTFDNIVVLFDELGFPDEEIMSRLQVAKQTIYNARTRQEPLIEAISGVSNPKSITYGRPDIAKVIDDFKLQFGTTISTKWDRYAAKRLVERYSVEAVCNVILIMAQNGGDKYAPAINSVADLEKKWPQVGKYINNLSLEQPLDI